MNKRKNMIRIIMIFMIIISMSFLPKSITSTAEITDGIEFYIGNSVGDKVISTADFNSEQSQYGDVELFLWAKSIGTVKTLGGIEVQFTFGPDFKRTSGPSLEQVKEYDSGRDGMKEVNLFTLIPMGVGTDKYMIGLNLDASSYVDASDYNIPLEGVKIAKFFASTVDGLDVIADNLTIGLDVTIAADYDANAYDSSSIESQGLLIGSGITAVPSTSLDNVKVIGDSGTVYHDGTLGSGAAINPVNLTYQDAQNPLFIEVTKESSTASVVYSGSSSPYSDQDTITITVTDDDDGTPITETYTLTLNVPNPSSLNDLEVLTINKGEISPAFSPSVTSYTVNLDYSETDLRMTASVNPDDLSSLDKTEIAKSYPIGTTTETFNVTAEDGTIKTYTINVVRTEASTDSSIASFFVDGQLVESTDGVVYDYTLDELDSNFNFKIVTTNSYAQIAYKLSSGSTYQPLAQNTNTASIPIDNGQSLTYDVKITAQDGSMTVYVLNIDRSPSTDTTLSQVKIVEGASTSTLTFSGGAYTYNLSNTGETSITVQTTIAANATVKILDPIGNEVSMGIIDTSSIGVGTHQYQIIVTAQDGLTENVVPLNLVKKSDQKDLIDIEAQDKLNSYEVFSFSAEDFTYNPSTLTYLYRFDYQYSSIRFQLTSSALSTITSSQGFNTGATSNTGYFDVTLTESTQSVTIIVIAEDSSTEEYTISFYKRAADGTNTLEDLQVDGVTINGFSSTKFNGYDRIIVPGTTTSVYVEGFVTDGASSTVTYNDGVAKQISLVRGDVKTVHIKVTAQNGVSNTYTIEIVAANENNEIQNVSFSNITHTFDPGTTSYTFNVPYTTSTTRITLTTPTGANSTAIGGGDKVLNEGTNVFKVYAISEAGIEGTEYTYTIIRNAPRTDKYLNSITVGAYSLTPSFLPSVYSYDLRVDNDVTEVLVNASVPSDNGSMIVSGLGNYALNSGQTKTVSIVVKAEDGSTQTYIINILRANNINTFESITIDGIEYVPADFDASYELHLSSVPFSKSFFNASIEKTDEFSVLTAPSINGSGQWILSSGQNVLQFYITSQAGTKGTTYKVIVTQNPANSNNDLLSLSVLNGGTELLVGDQTFNATKLTYRLRVDANTDQVTILASVDPGYNSTLTGAGIKVLTLTTEMFIIRVTAENGDIQEYKVEITRKNDNHTINDIVFEGFESIGYNQTTFAYDLGTVAYTTSSLNLEVMLADNTANLFVNGKAATLSSTVNLNQGLNTITIYAVSEYGTKGETYTYTLTRQVAQTNADLETLEVLIDGVNVLIGDQAFDKSKLSYTFRADKDVDEIQINASVNPAYLSIISGTGVKPILDGSNKFQVQVTAEDGVTTKVYTIDIIRASDNRNITDIIVGDYETVIYDETIYTYDLGSAPYSLASLDFTVLLEDPTATIYVNNKIVSESSNVTLKEGLNTIKVHAKSEFGTIGQTYTYTIVRASAQTNADLSDLQVLVDGVDILTGDQAFSASKLSYVLRVDNAVTQIEIIGTVNPIHLSKIVGSGIKPVVSGLNTFTVTVTAEDGTTTKTYSIQLTKASDNRNITDIIVGDYETVIYDETIYTYDLGSAPYSLASLDFTVLLEDPTATIYVNNKIVSESSNVTLKEGLNTIKVHAKSEFGTIGQTYTYTIVRASAQTNADLSDLQVLVDGVDILTGDQAFSASKLSYVLRVDRDINQLEIKANTLPEHLSTITGKGIKALALGNNVFQIEVLAEDGITSKTYLIQVTRANNNHNISNILVNGQSIGYDPLTKTYTLGDVTFNVASIDIDVSLEDPYATVNLSGTQTLVNGINTFNIVATAEDGTKGQTYSIVINKLQANSENLLNSLEVLVNGVNVLVGDQAFVATKNVYTLRVDNDITEVELLATVDPLDRSTLTGTGVRTLITGDNQYSVKVRAENGTENIYIINISRQNNNYNIANILIDQFEEIIYQSDVFTYDLGQVSNSVNAINIQVVLEDVNAKIRINGVLVTPSSQHILKEGINTFNIQVESQFGDLGPIYTYTIEQEAAKSIADLLDLEVIASGSDLLIGEHTFDPDTLIYTLRVDRTISQIQINPFVDQQSHASFTGQYGNRPLAIGKNIFEIYVTAEDKTTTKTYLIEIYRNNDDHSIQDIMIDGISIGFDPSTLIYEMMPYQYDVNTVEVTAIANDPFATISGVGTIILKDGTISVKVYATSDFGTKGLEYTIKLTRNAAFNDAGLLSLVSTDGAGNVLSYTQGAFNKNITGYTIELDSDSTISHIDITALLLNDQKQSLSGDIGLQTLNIIDGEINQTFSLTVTAESGLQKTYSITVLKGTNLSSNASINRVTLTDASGKSYLTFNPLIAIQNDVILDYQTSLVNLVVIPNDQNATVIGNGTFSLNADQTVTLAFQVIAQDGTTSSLEYRVNVHRLAPSDDNTLKSLEILSNGTDLLLEHNAFSPSKYTYTLKVNRNIDVIDIKADANHIGASISGDINQVSLQPGLQQLKIFVKSESGIQKTYFINIEVVNSHIEVITLSVDHYQLNYQKDILQYDLGDISSYVETLNIKALIPSTSYGTLSGDIGVVQLNYGLNIYTITAMSEDQSESVTYQIIANRLEPDTNNFLSDLYVTDGVYRLPFSNAVFNKDVEFYQIILDKTSNIEFIQIYATAENSSLPTGTGQFLLTSVAGVIHNDFYVTVTAENGDVKTYQIQVIKSDSSDLSADKDIKNIVISTSNKDYPVNFNQSVEQQQSIILDYQDSSFFVDITAHEKATVIGRDLYKINPGETITIVFYVEAENGDQSLIYNMDVTRSLPDSDQTPLRLYVIIDGQSIDLDVTESYHVYDVADALGSIGIEAEIKDSQTIIGVGTKKLINEQHKFYVVVTAEDGTPNVYTIEVNKRSNDASLKSIMINGVERFGHFYGNLIVLDDVLFEEDTIDIFAVASHIDAVVTGNGTHQLSVGKNIIEVYATSELGEQGSIYQIEITRLEASSDASLASLVVKNNQNQEILTYSPVFNASVLKYTIALSLSDQVQEILIEGIANDTNILSIEGLGVYTLKAASSQTTEIFNITITAEDGSKQTYELHVTRDVSPEDDVTIDELTLFGETILYLGTASHALTHFTMGQTHYEITVPYHLSSIYLTISNLNGAAVIGSGMHLIDEMDTTLTFYLISKSGNIQSETYTVVIHKEAPSDSNLLDSLTIDGQLIQGFDPEIFVYNINVSFEDVNQITIDAVAQHAYAQVLGNLGEVSLEAGTNLISISVHAENGEIQTYRINVNRLSNANDLLDLYIKDFDMNHNFEEERSQYQVVVPYTTTYVEIIALANEKAVVMNIGIQYLEVGENIYEIYAVSESGLNGKVYTVTVIRTEVSQDSSLSDLVIRDAMTNEIILFAPVFSPTTTEYVISLEKETTINSLMIEGVANDPFATVGGNGYKVLKAQVDGYYHNIFEVTVRAQDHSTTTYTISVYKDVVLSDSISIESVTLTGSDGVAYLATENGMLQFVPSVHTYHISVPYNVTSMSLDIETQTAKVYGGGTKTFIDDQIIFETYIVSQSGLNTSETYIITVTRDSAEEDNGLSDLKVNDKTITGFDPDKTYYEIDIPYLTMDSIHISATQLNLSAQVTGDLGTHILEEGRNIYTINVIAQNGDVKTYTIAINYLNANAYLEQLSVINSQTETPYQFTFNPDTFEYTVSIGKNDSEIIIWGEAQDQNRAAIIGLGKYNVSEYGTTAVVNVIASDNKTTQTYTINIVRETLPSSNTKLVNLNVSGYNLSFNPDTKSYVLNVNHSTSALDIEAIAECPYAKVTVLGAEDIDSGKNVVMVRVDAEDGSQAYYQLTVNKDTAPDNFLTMLLIISLLVWIITILIFLIKSTRQKKDFQKNVIR